MKVLVACETSGIVRDAFLEMGHDAWSCDILPAEECTNRHIQGDARQALKLKDWDLLIAHPPCTRLCNSGVRWLSEPPKGKTPGQMWAELDEGARLFSDMLNAPIPRIAVENPVMHKYAKQRIEGYFKFSQSIQPWQFEAREEGPEDVKKRTCLWLKNLPLLVPTGPLDGSTARGECHHASPGPDRWKIRSRFYRGIAAAMADQWGQP